jgi:hypothetical protein
MIQDAKAMKRMSADTPVVHREFSLAFEKCWDGLVYAQLRFLNAVFGHPAYRQNASDRKRRQVGRRVDDITKAIRCCDALVGKLSGANRSNQDRHERDILASFLIQRAIPFVEFWQEAIAAVDDGASLQIKPRDIPTWFDEIPSDRG